MGFTTDRRRRPQRKPLPQDIASQVETSIQVGRYVVGMRLPPERELCVRMGASRNVLREALRILETRGVVEIRHGVGTFIAQNPASERAQIPIEVRLRRATFPVDEVMVVRRAIECAVVEVAARARDETDLEALRELLDHATRCMVEGDVETYIDLDIKFHEFLGTCTHNRLLEDIQGELTKATLSVRSIASETSDAMRAAIDFHGEILDALTRGDGEAARAAMVMHLLDARARLVAALVAGEERGNGRQP
ncbi:MAG: FadR/GntR family transcriptional regulator [Actinomycetota bacterium]|nr:FadR/GntR family transcriptional regulator [Actinomycetota bacterium]